MIIALEGLCYAGKTTTCKALCQIQKDLFPVAEYSKLIDPSKFPDYKCRTKESIIFFIKLEKIRQKIIKEKIKEGLIPVLDRSFISCIAFDYAMCKMGIKNKNFWKTTEKLFLTQNFILPDIIFFFDVSQVEIKTRAKENPCKMPSFFVNVKFNQFFKEFIVSQHHIPVKIINANVEPETVMKQVLTKFKP